MPRESTQLNAQLVAVLDREFERIRLLKNDPGFGKTSGEMARTLAMPASTLSHYRAGNRFLTKTSAQDVAAILRSNDLGGTPEERIALAEELFACRPVASENQVQAQDWLRSIGRPGHLLLVEFRDYPIASRSNPNWEVAREMAKEAGRAVAKGLTYALLNPFPPSYQGPGVDAALQTYFKQLTEEITNTHKRILEEAYRQIILEGRGEPELNDVQKRLRVYTWARNTDPLDACVGLGYKLYYHREELRKSELWHWLSTDDGERLILKYAESPERAAIEFRYYPILECLEYENSLPTDDDMKKRADLDYNRKPLWVVTDEISPEENRSLIERAKLKPS